MAMGCAVAGLAGCSDWPRFANLPPPSDATPSIGEFSEQTLDEEGVDRPDDPTGLGTQYPGLVDWYRIVRFEGVLDPDGSVDDDADVEWPACRAGDPEALPFDHQQADVDWLAIELSARPTCIALELVNDDCPRLGADDECLWDAILFRYEPAVGCTTGTFLNPPDASAPDKPGLIVASSVLYLDRQAGDGAVPGLGTQPDAGVYALALSGASSRASAPTAYSVAVSHTPTLEACIQLGDELQPPALPEAR
jgi:hypothetical protein